MATNKLTATFCKTAPQGLHFDGGGLHLLVKPDGKRYWRMACRLNGQRKQLAFGSYPKVSLAEAREERTKAQKLLKQGIDPVQHTREVKEEQKQAEIQEAIEAENTFAHIVRRLHENKAGKTTEEYRDKMLRQFEIHLFPVIGMKPLRNIEGKELLALFRNVAGKTNHGRPMTYMAKKLCQWTAEVYDLAHVEDATFSLNPCRAIIKHLPSHDTQHMPRISFNELPRFIRALNEYGGHPLTKAAIWMLLYTGQRQVSVRRARWSDFDLDAVTWHRRPEKMDKKGHDLPLPRQAITLLESIRPLTGQGDDDLAFPSVQAIHRPMSEAAICQAIRRMGFIMVGHGLRGVVSTGLNELGFNHRVVDVQLGHKNDDAIEAAYNDAKHFAQRQEMMQQWADHLERAATLQPVIPINKQA